jgi:pyruvate-formate lyase-activating enzyme
MDHPDTLPALVLADHQGNITDFPELGMTGMSNGAVLRPALEDLIPLPEGSELFTLPGRLPIGWDHANNEPVVVASDPFRSGKGAQAVAAFMAPAHTAILSASYQSEKQAPLLPLFAYTAIGWHKERFWVAGLRTDQDHRQDARYFNQQIINKKTRTRLKAYPRNRLIQHLGKCCLVYGCPAARNYFLERWEAPLPTSPVCNARCLGCISLQPSGCCPATQDRITFVPTAKEIGEIGIPHLQHAENPIVSFGQGCEGEPLLQTKTIAEAIELMRKETARGTINLNSNASLPQSVALLAGAGLDSIRVSLNSAQERYYQCYYRPQGYTFADVMRSIEVMKAEDRHVSLNYFILPGFSDAPEEYEALRLLISRYRPDFIQLRNLNMDPEWYLKDLRVPQEGGGMGIRKWLLALQNEFPELRFGYFNPQVGSC